ncbi:hypothetical protein HIM_04656 [Hirsutella minnesotensis 3608]|uniref:Uncharacterized protein n=1 Tax=Hirsutella minnesotensis 3608 TaxID=1043627 RepID=A0A0F8A135_9HYPO|nr:hypothetical protein HIM_04656 [Hirsutella minnesotensis 3608]
MLRRNSTRSSPRRPLSRSKSTSSGQQSPVRNLVSIDPAVAERDACIAANLSYHRALAHARRSYDMTPAPRELMIAPTTSQSIKSGRTLVSTLDESQEISQDPSTQCSITRQKSVRFAGPNAKPRRPLALRAIQAPVHPAHGPSETRQSFTQGRGQFGSSDLESQLYSSDAPTVHESGPRLPLNHLFPDDAAIPTFPALGRLRKSRSAMACPALPTSEFDLSDEPDERLRNWLAGSRHVMDDKENELGKHHGSFSLRAPKSMSFLRGGSEHHGQERTRSRLDNDSSQLARHDTLRRRLRPRPSTLLRPKQRRQDNSSGLPKSLRNSSNSSAALSSAFSGNSIPVSHGGGLRVKARKVSNSLRSKLRGLFGRQKSADNGAESLGSHPPSISDCGSYLQANQPSEPEEAEASMSRVPSHVPSLHAVPSNQQLQSRKGSLESIRLDPKFTSEDKSRVTSWANSTVATAASVCSHSDREWQRLSVICENTMNGPSHVDSHQRNPLIASTHSKYPRAPGGAVDSQRVYEALMKRLNETRQQGHSIPSLPSRSLDRVVSNDACTQADLQSQARASIRCVQAEDDVFRTEDEAGLSEVSNESLEPRCNQPRSQSEQHETSYHASDKISGGYHAIQSTETQPATESGASKTLAYGSSAFFASPTGHLFRTASPYRRALRESIKEARQSETLQNVDVQYLSSLSALSLPTRRSSPAKSDKNVPDNDSESVYSCLTEDTPANQPGIGAATYELMDTISAGQDAMMRTSSVLGVAPEAHERNTSLASSIEWKTWLSANVSKLETPSTTASPGSQEFTPCQAPRYGHVREEAEIDSTADFSTPDERGTGLFRGSPAKSRALSPYQASPSRALRWTSAARNGTDENSPPTTGKRFKSARQTRLPLVPSRPNVKSTPSTSGSPAVSAAKSNYHGRDLPRMRSLITMKSGQSPTRVGQYLRRRGRSHLDVDGTSSAHSSPGLTAAVEKQFGKLSTHRQTQESEQVFDRKDVCTSMGKAETGSAERGRSWDAQVMGSKRMVDLFLSSRRKRIKGSKAEIESENTSVVFL